MDIKTLSISSLALFFATFVITFALTPGDKKTVASTSTQVKTSVSSAAPEEDPDPKTEECPMNGAMYSAKAKTDWETRRPMGVMIENHLESRPQSGISNADIVYEAVAEGGITRTLNIFYCKLPALVGPVRSARIYFMKLLKEYGQNPLYVHVGGANCDAASGSGCANGAKADALGFINKWGWGGYNDLNQFSVPFPIFYRDYERLPNVATEHTMYASPAKLYKYAADKRKLTSTDEKQVKWSDKSKTTPAFVSWKFNDDEKAEARGKNSKISYVFWKNNLTNDYSVAWNYDAIANTYKRENAGAKHLDKNTDKQIESKNVVVLFAKESPANDGYAGGHLLYELNGTGEAQIFMNGNKIDGKWSKVSDESRMKFTDKTGKEISFVRGQIFISVLPIGNTVEVQ
jgi:hypothetical protein